MKDEIKEILDLIRELVEQSPNRGFYGITHKKWKQLLDYITNLQTDNKRLQHNEKVYKSRNKKAIELVKSLIIFWKKYTPDNTMEIGQFENILSVLDGEQYNKVERAYLDDELIGNNKDE